MTHESNAYMVLKACSKRSRDSSQKYINYTAKLKDENMESIKIIHNLKLQIDHLKREKLSLKNRTKMFQMQMESIAEVIISFFLFFPLSNKDIQEVQIFLDTILNNHWYKWLITDETPNRFEVDSFFGKNIKPKNIFCRHNYFFF